MTDCECIVIGAGVVGLAIAANLAQSGLEVVILDREASYGSITSARNSEVIHAGIYYAAGSLKAQFCVSGRQALYRYCQDRHIGHEPCGKLIVATNESQVSELASIRQHAQVNGVSDITQLSQQEARSLEPDLSCLAALHSPSTGIIDSHGLMLNLLGDAEAHGAVLALHAPVVGIAPLPSGGGYEVCVSGDNAMKLTSRLVINAAGHGACEIAMQLEALPEGMCPEPILSKGNYFRLQGKAPFSRLIYPVPEVGGLGVHITIDLAGQARFGPDVEPVNEEEYSVDPSRSAGFYAAVRQYWPGLPDDSLTPDYAGIRPKIRWQNSLYNDFLITSARDHGLPGLVNLFGIESPGLTSCLAIAEHVKLALDY
jgi:L-2-hydroxyglutarate oxidase LhgO